MSEPEPITVIIQSRNRPIYLWACLDSFYRYTKHPVRFVFFDNASDDPMVREVVRGFERRGMFHAVHWFDDNDSKRLLYVVRDYVDGPGDKIVVVDSDVAVFDTNPCWLGQMSALIDETPHLGLLGSYVDKRDFVPLEDIPTLLPDKSAAEAGELGKAFSLERDLPDVPPEEPLIDPFNPPGRLVMVRKGDLPKLAFMPDGDVYKMAQQNGIRCAIATQVRHRHLSFLNAYDYPDYDIMARSAHFRQNREGTPVFPPQDTSD